MEGGCTVIGCYGVLDSTELGEFALEFRDKSAYRGDPTRGETFEHILAFATIENRRGHGNAWRGCGAVSCSLISRGHYGAHVTTINPADQAAHDRLKHTPAPMLRRYVSAALTLASFFTVWFGLGWFPNSRVCIHRC